MRHFQLPVSSDTIVCDLRSELFYLLTEEIQFRIRETDLVARQIKKLLFDGFNGVIGVNSLGKKHDIDVILDNCLEFVFTKYGSEEWILSLLDKYIIDVYNGAFIRCEFNIAIENV
jgi:hypothetical protein